jgi:hypothetical protein
MRTVVVVGLVTSTAVTGVSSTAFAAPASPATCGWHAVSSHVVYSNEKALTGVAAISENDVWVIGQSAEHWNGTKWTHFQPPKLYGKQVLDSIAAISSKDIWVVSDSGLIDHWNGARWKTVTAPGDPSNGDEPPAMLYDVAGSSAANVWAVGYDTGGDGGSQAEAIHWDGRTWTITAPPGPLDESYPYDYGLRAVGTIPGDPSFSLAVGDGEINSSGNAGGGGYGNRWNGVQWTLLRSPVDATGIAAVSRKDAWAVGDGIEQWNGVKWEALPSETLPPDSTLNAISARSATDVWAVGRHPDSAGRYRVLIEHWNGTQWAKVPAPPVVAGWRNLAGVSTLPDGGAWAVGGYAATPPTYQNHNSKPLIERYSPCKRTDSKTRDDSVP